MAGIPQAPEAFEGDNFIEILRDMRDLLRENNARNFNRVQRTDFAGVPSYTRGRALDFSDAAFTDRLVEIPPTHRLTITDWPFELQQLEIRLHTVENPTINILRAGTVIESDTPIQRFFVTSSPGSLSGFLEFFTGGIKVTQPRWSLLNPLSFEQRRKHVRIQNQGSFAPTLTLPALNQPALFTVFHRATGIGNTTLIDNIPANHRCRVYGHMNVENASVDPNFSAAAINWETAAAVVRNIIIDFRWGEPDGIFYFDTEYITDTVETQLAFSVASIGPVGNTVRTFLNLEIHPL